MKRFFLLCILLAVGAIGFWLISPLFFNTEVNEELPGDYVNQETSDQSEVIAQGEFVDVAHEGTGGAQVITLGASQNSIVRLVDLDVLNGPDLRVLLSKNSNIRSSSDLGEYIELGKLKGNKGTQNYTLPQDTNLQEYHSVVIYCKPFHVVFNSADLK